MKKFATLAISLVIILMIGIVSFAWAGGFVESPSVQKTVPKLESFEPLEDNTCDGWLIITPYINRYELNEFDKAQFQEGYDEIAATIDLKELTPDIITVAQRQDIKTEDLAVADLFYVHIEGCTDCVQDKYKYKNTAFEQWEAPDLQETALKPNFPSFGAGRKGNILTALSVNDLPVMQDCEYYVGGNAYVDHGKFLIDVSSDTLKRYVCLLHFFNDAWEVVPNARIVGNGLEFKTETLGSFAIVVKREHEETSSDSGNTSSGNTSGGNTSSGGHNPPRTGSTWLDNSLMWGLILVVSGAIIAILILLKKSKKDDEK